MKFFKILAVLMLVVSINAYAVDKNSKKNKNNTKNFEVTEQLVPYTSKQYKRARRGFEYTVLYFEGKCKTCDRQKAVVENVAKKYPTVKFFEIDTKKQKQAMKKFKVRYPGTIIITKKGKIINKSIKMSDKEKLERKFKKYLKV